jgi:hypothetical protein
MRLELILIWIGRIRIGMPWMRIRFRILQIDADATRSRSTTLSKIQQRKLRNFISCCNKAKCNMCKKARK